MANTSEVDGCLFTGMTEKSNRLCPVKTVTKRFSFLKDFKLSIKECCEKGSWKNG